MNFVGLTGLNNSSKIEKFLFYITLIAVPFIIYYYFLPWKTNTIYGDDLIMFRDHYVLKTFNERIHWHLAFQKYRPVHGLVMNFVIEWFGKDINAYYIFNIVIQTIITFVFALILNLFLRSPLFSLLFSLVGGLSRFAFFNVSQLLNGGALEGLAMVFFLLSLYYLLKVQIAVDLTEKRKRNIIITSILFSNLALYTHERYVVIFPIIALVILIAPNLLSFSLRKRVLFGVLSFASILVNVLIKDIFFSMPFFVGTGGANMSLSISSALNYLMEGVVSILHFNIGPEYLVGVSFFSLSIWFKCIVFVLVLGCLSIMILFVKDSFKKIIDKNRSFKNVLFAFLTLIPLFFILLLPAIVTIRLEQRWLQASLCIFILLFTIALANINFQNKTLKNASYLMFVSLFLLVDYNYLAKGVNYLYLKDSERIAYNFQQAMEDETIKFDTDKVYIWENKIDLNYENSIIWSLAEGYLFSFYQNESKEIAFVDSTYQKQNALMGAFIDKEPGSEQIVLLHSKLVDLTDDYLSDSLKSFKSLGLEKFMELESKKASLRRYKQDSLLITVNDFNSYAVNGFYENENGIRWTNGNSTIDLLGNFPAKKLFQVELSTYLPPAFKELTPSLTLIDDYYKEIKSDSLTKSGDKFVYSFNFLRPVKVRKILISAKKVKATPPDTRVLSFPFISLKMKSKSL
ncbi:hypothetical protein [Rufibacter latericius]|uniref:Glycosyltransferase RgtA/B/C/D-like domain-containing protein n=1 Tax=Rufibacter latericius TaxID=2487040 RepID=A0A3M9MUN0_9BACT|nr:hypothetical protein [Rufibacter latericius]RNI29231.1 hypothetical protein EFB08_07365 [Rufibacter latericius]